MRTMRYVPRNCRSEMRARGWSRQAIERRGFPVDILACSIECCWTEYTDRAMSHFRDTKTSDDSGSLKFDFSI